MEVLKKVNNVSLKIPIIFNYYTESTDCTSPQLHTATTVIPLDFKTLKKDRKTLSKLTKKINISIQR